MFLTDFDILVRFYHKFISAKYVSLCVCLGLTFVHSNILILPMNMACQRFARCKRHISLLKGRSGQVLQQEFIASRYCVNSCCSPVQHFSGTKKVVVWCSKNISGVIWALKHREYTCKGYNHNKNNEPSTILKKLRMRKNYKTRVVNKMRMRIVTRKNK